LKKEKNIKISLKSKIELGEIIEINSVSDFQEKLYQIKSCFVYFFDNEKPSNEFTEILKEKISNNNNIKVLFVNVVKNPEIAENNKINFVPLLSYFRDGKIRK